MNNELTDCINLRQIGHEVAQRFNLPLLTEDSNNTAETQASVIAYTLEEGVESLMFLKNTGSGFDSASLQLDVKSQSQLKLTYTYLNSSKNRNNQGNSMQVVLPVSNQELIRKLAYGTAEFILSE